MTGTGAEITLRPGTTAAAPDCGRICYEAFRAIAEHHRPPGTARCIGLYTEPVGAHLPSILY